MDFIIKKTFALAIQKHKENNLKMAESLYQKILKIKPNHAPSHNNLGIIFETLGNIQNAKICYEKAILINPDYAHAYNNLGMIFKELDQHNNAIEAFKTAIKIEPDYLAAHHNLGLVFQKKKNHEEALQCFKKAIKIKSDSSESYYSLGMVFVEKGELERGAEAYSMATKYDPENLSYFFYLGELKNEILNLNLKKKIISILKKKNCTKKNLAYGNFLLAKYEAKNRNYKKEFNFLIEGHHQYSKFKINKFKQQIKYWLKILPNNKKLNNLIKFRVIRKKTINDIKPIFIVGVPRSGSTLLEKVIASSVEKIPAGEETEVINYFVKEEILKRKYEKFDFEKLKQKIIKKYEEKGLIKKEKNYMFTDKSLDNFFYINLIKEIFPNSKIINCRRNPLSCIISILKNNITGLGWAHELENIFEYINIYYNKIHQFKEKNPQLIYELEYEKFVINPELESKKLLDYCNLSWDVKCLNFFKRKDLISQTASNIQIRKGIYQDSVKKYLNYKQFLNKFNKKYKWFNPL